MDCIILHDPGLPPYGPVLIANIAAYVYPFWKDTANQRIIRTVRERVEPFTSFLWVTEPMSPGGEPLTPLTIGLVILEILDGVLKVPSWPGIVSATIFSPHSRGELAQGSLTLSNAPLTNPDSANNNTVQAIAPAYEKRWLRCWQQMFRDIMERRFDDLVSDHVRIRPDPGRVTSIAIFCGPNSRDSYKSIFFWRARVEVQNPLTYDRLAEGMVQWVTAIADGHFDATKPWRVHNGRRNEPLATMAVELDLSGSSATA